MKKTSERIIAANKRYSDKIKSEKYGGLTKIQYELKCVIDDFKLTHNRLPYQYELCSITGKESRAIGKILAFMGIDYPENLMISPHVKNIYDHFEDGMTLQELADKVGMKYNVCYNFLAVLESMGCEFKMKKYASYEFLPRIDRRKRNTETRKSEEKLVGIQITDGEYKGKYGYLNEDLNAVIHIDGIQKIIKVETGEYKDVGKAI